MPWKDPSDPFTRPPQGSFPGTSLTVHRVHITFRSGGEVQLAIQKRAKVNRTTAFMVKSEI